MTKDREVYFNDKQIEGANAHQKTQMYIWGRGTGKSSLIALKTYQGISQLPKAKVFFSATSYNQILTKTLPAIEQLWQKMGLKEHISNQEPGHYIVGKKPPNSWIKPYSAPKKYENVVSFIWGYCIEFLSMDRADGARGGSYDGGHTDEIALIKQDHYTKVLIPSIRGNKYRFTHHSHGQFNGYTSMPWKTSGKWVLEFEEKAKTYPELYYNSFANIWDNIDVLGKEEIERLYRELPYLTARMELDNIMIKKLPDGFYPKFDEEKHTYTPKYDYDFGERGIMTKGPQDIDKTKLLELSFDFGGYFSGLTVFQEKDNIEKLLRKYEAEENETVKNLTTKFCEDNKNHKFKYVRIYGEPRGHDKRPEGDTLYNIISKELIKHGWEVEMCVEAQQTELHEMRYNDINNMLEETNPDWPSLRINEVDCKDVIIAIQTTRVGPDFKKVKTDEKNRNFNQKHAPHFTDTIDYYFFQKHGWKFSGVADIQMPMTASFLS